jgi:hypothetical protein
MKNRGVLSGCLDVLRVLVVVTIVVTIVAQYKLFAYNHPLQHIASNPRWASSHSWRFLLLVTVASRPPH